MTNKLPVSCLVGSELLCVQILPTDIAHSAIRMSISNMGVITIPLDDCVTPPWKNATLLEALSQHNCRQIVILTPELTTFVHVLSQTVLQLGFLTIVACGDLEDVALHKILRLTQVGVILISPDGLMDELSLTEP